EQGLNVAAHSKELKCADANVAGSDAGEHRTRQRRLSADRLTRGNDGKRPGCGDTERVHGLADDVLAQNRAKRRPAIAVAGERGGAGTLELDVAAHAIQIDDFAKQQGATVTQLGNEG